MFQTAHGEIPAVHSPPLITAPSSAPPCGRLDFYTYMANSVNGALRDAHPVPATPQPLRAAASGAACSDGVREGQITVPCIDGVREELRAYRHAVMG
jgi:hypothetical protein